MFNRSLTRFVLLGLTAIIGAGCSMLNPAPTLAPVPPVVTMAPAMPTLITVVPTLGALDVVTATPARTDVPENTPAPLASPTRAPVVIAAAATATPRPQPTRTTAPSGPLFSTVKIYLVAINDNGVSGPRIGCNDSLIAVTRQIQPTNAPLTAALNELLSLRQRDYGQSGLITALYQSTLKLQNVAIVNGVATIRLTGEPRPGGECDDPRIIGQLDYTARQFSTVRSTAILVNGVPIQTVLSGKGQ